MSSNKPETTPSGSHRDLFDKADLYIAYRKAKADVLHQSFQAKIADLMKYESNLDQNIDELFCLLQQDNWADDDRLSIGINWIPKFSWSEKARPHANILNNSGYSEWSTAAEHSSKSDLKPDPQPAFKLEFRPISNAPIHLHVISALWIATVGERYDSWLSKSVYGSRVPRVGPTRLYNRASISSFAYYPQAYKQWRKSGIDTIRAMVKRNENVVAFTWDFKRFFERIDPAFIISPKFSQDFIKKSAHGCPALEEQHHSFTGNLAEVFSRYGLGLPIGVAASAVFANILLREFDCKIEQTLTPLYYGRYMDDLFLVLKNPGRSLRTDDDIRQYVISSFNSQECPGAPAIQVEGNDIHLVLDQDKYCAKTKLMFNADKQRYFLIDCQAGHDIVDMMDEALEKISSERRLLPGKAIMSGAFAHALTLPLLALDGYVDLMRGSDSASLRRLGLANILAAFKHFGSVFEPHEWSEEREWFCRACVDHVLPPQYIFELAQYTPRIVSMFVSAGDWNGAAKILRSVKRSLHYLVQQSMSVESMSVEKSERYKVNLFYDFMCHWILEDSLAATPFEWRDGEVSVSEDTERQVSRLMAILRIKSDGDDKPESVRRLKPLFEDIQNTVSRIYWFDLGYTSPSAHLANEVWAKSANRPRSPAAFDALCQRIPEYREGAEIVLPKKNDPPSFMLFPTRRMTSIMLSRVAPESVSNIDKWKKANKFGRSISWKAGQSHQPPGDIRSINSQKWPPKSRDVAVLSIATSDRDWSRSVASPNDGRERYEQLAEVINSLIQSKKPPSYALFPELSVPARFADVFGYRLARSKVSSIMGVEYQEGSATNARGRASRIKKLENNAQLYLIDNRLGYSTCILQVEHKSAPAIHEREDLRKLYNASLHSSKGKGCRVYYHEGVAFAVLVCSELTNISYRARLAGHVDILFVPSWNKDVTTFSALVESATLDPDVAFGQAARA